MGARALARAFPYSSEIFAIFCATGPTSSKSPDFSPSSPHSEGFGVSRYKTKKVLADLPDVGVSRKPKIVGLDPRFSGDV